MSDQGQNPYGQPYAQPGPPPYGPPPGQNPYGAQSHGQWQYGQPQGYGQPPTAHAAAPGGYASWGQRAVAWLWDYIVYQWPALLCFLAAVVFVVLGAASAGADNGGLAGIFFLLGGVLYLAGFVVAIWRLITNVMLDQGRTGYTYGKRKVGIRTVSAQTGQPAGVGSCVGRYFLHALINQVFYLDYLWPLWDQQRRTLTDLVLSTVVVTQPDTSPRY